MTKKTSNKLNVRRSIQAIYDDFTKGNTTELEKLMVAWQFIKALPPSDPNSFMVLGGYHGEPFLWRGSYDANYWGGYCNHGNILFPTWHRIYLHKLEQALQSVPGCASVTLPYWDQTYMITKPDGTTTYLGVPPILTDEYFTFSDGSTIPNPLRSFVLPMALQDGIEANFYSKPAGYETVRYPLSGLVGTAPERAKTEVNNSAYFVPGTNNIDYKLTASLLNQNVVGWLDGSVKIPKNFDPTQPLTPVKDFRGGVHENYQKCLDAPCYVVFSNNTSRNQWNQDHPNPKDTAQSLESPHGSIHLAVGGINAPGQDADTTPVNNYILPDANGDMGENETAGLDPIFFFHHCNVDRIFWIWQNKHKSTDELNLIVPGWSTTDIAKKPYPGMNNATGQPPVGYEPTELLTLESPLYPFKMNDNGNERYYKSSDGFNIETQLGYKYDNLSIDNHDGAPQTAKVVAALDKLRAMPHKSDKVLIVSGINRAKIDGSFVITAYATIDGERYYLGDEPVLSRWRVAACKNCTTHLEAEATFGLSQFTEDEIGRAVFEIQIDGRRNNDAEFAKFRVANQANMAKFLTAQAAAATAPEAKGKLAALAAAPSVAQHAVPKEKAPFKLMVK